MILRPLYHAYTVVTKHKRRRGLQCYMSETDSDYLITIYTVCYLTDATKYGPA